MGTLYEEWDVFLAQYYQYAPGMASHETLHPSSHDRPPVHIHTSDFTAASSNAGPYQRAIGIPFDVDLPSPSDLPNPTLFEESGSHGVTSPGGTNSVGAAIIPDLQVLGIYKLCYGAMAPPVHHNPSQSQSQPQSMAQVQQHRIRPPPKVWCHKPQCKAGFHAKKALNRHLEDCHSEKKKCHYPDCNFTYVGKRKLDAHLQKIHGKAPRRRTLELKE
ncbi:hypothetical protein BGW80DRAFT_1377451 [Lactifluus volemus]|nr:hypothetical protein BGW80DRAFT_1377451 [Lactifluus volemus]